MAVAVGEAPVVCYGSGPLRHVAQGCSAEGK